LIKRLSIDQIKVNVTAVMTIEQVMEVIPALSDSPQAYFSIFAGRITDTGRDPTPLSTRELFNIVQAREAGCHIITVPCVILKRIDLLGKDLNELSIETVKMFYQDALAADFAL
jgi:transaldolase